MSFTADLAGEVKNMFYYILFAMIGMTVFVFFSGLKPSRSKIQNLLILIVSVLVIVVSVSYLTAAPAAALIAIVLIAFNMLSIVMLLKAIIFD